MNEEKPTLILTNDDGIFAKGIHHLWNSLKNDFDLIIAAPATEKSGCGLSTTIHGPLLFKKVNWIDPETEAWSVQGTPADCVKLALKVLTKKSPAMVISGINLGSNSGRTVLYSGTVGSIIEAALRDMPGIAFSSQSFDTPRFEEYEPFIPTIVKHFFDQPLPKGSFLNVTFPSDYEGSPKGLKMARQGKGFWTENFHERTHPEGYSYYWQSAQWKVYDEAKDSDVALLNQGYITLVPLHINDMTDHRLIDIHAPFIDQLSKTSDELSKTKF